MHLFCSMHDYLSFSGTHTFTCLITSCQNIMSQKCQNCSKITFKIMTFAKSKHQRSILTLMFQFWKLYVNFLVWQTHLFFQELNSQLKCNLYVKSQNISHCPNITLIRLTINTLWHFSLWKSTDYLLSSLFLNKIAVFETMSRIHIWKYHVLIQDMAL